MWEKWVFHSDIKLTDSTMIISLSTGAPQYFMLYSQGRELAKYFLEHFENEKLASYYASTMEEFVSVNDSVGELTGYTIHRLAVPSNTKQEILLFSGYSSPRSHVYEFCDSILTTAKERWGVKQVISIGARWSEEPTQPVIEESKVYGFVGSSEDTYLLRKAGVVEHPSEIAPYFANIVVAMAPLYGMSSMKLSVDHGEVRPHPKQLKALIQALGRLYDFEVDPKNLDEEAEKLKVDVELILKNLRKDGKQDEGQNQMFM